MAMIKTEVSPEKRTYTGEQLRPHFLLREFGLKGSAVGVFIGPCHVTKDNLVDWEDRLASMSEEDTSTEIHSKEMVHFVGEFFGMSLKEGVLIQRLLIAIIKDILEELGVASGSILRDGNDLYVGRAGFEKKLSVSIVTVSPVSVLLHAGINVDAEGAPVEAVGLNELDVEVGGASGFIEQVLQRFTAELSSIEWACSKVRPVI